MHLSNLPVTRLFFVAVGILFIASSCDSPPSGSGAEQKLLSETDQFFSFNPDSVGPVLTMAIDTLQARNEVTPFVKDFIAERGLPVWEAYTVFYQEGHPVLQVPVRAARKQKITGLTNIMITDTQPAYYWIDRDAPPKGIDANALETIMWGYEKVVFGKTHTDEGAIIRIKTKKDLPKTGNIMLDAPSNCSSTCIPGACHEAEWQCSEDGSGEGDNDGYGGNDSGGGRDGRGGDGGDGNSGDGDSAADAFEERITSENLNPCMQDELTDIKAISVGVGEIVHEFAIDEIDPDPALGNLNWVLEDGNLDTNPDGSVQFGLTYDYDVNTNTAYTKFDPYHFRDASRLGVAQVMFHEAVHAYLLAYFREDQGGARKSYPQLVEDYIESGDNLEHAHHMEMARNFVNDMATALEQFGWNSGVNIDFEYYQDLAWGGLTETEYFEELSTERQNRIQDRLAIELTSRNLDNEYATPKDDQAGC